MPRLVLAGVKRRLLLSEPAKLLLASARALRRGGLPEFLNKTRTFMALRRTRPVAGEPRLDRRDYREWVRRYDTWTAERRAALVQRVARMAAPPRISVVMPTYNGG